MWQIVATTNTFIGFHEYIKHSNSMFCSILKVKETFDCVKKKVQSGRCLVNCRLDIDAADSVVWALVPLRNVR